MKKAQIAVSLLLIFAASTLVAQTAAQEQFDQVKAMAGTWQGKSANGMPVQVSYRVTSSGSAVMSEIAGKEDMITMFNMDGAARLLATHYCSVGNQPRMVANSSADGKTITFSFLDATNLEASQPGHMQRLVIAMLSPDHHTEEWDFTGKGGERKEVFDLWRK